MSSHNYTRPIYLHFLDRELRRAENAFYDDSAILLVLIVSLLKSYSYCYCSASLVLESNIHFNFSTKVILELEKYGFIKLLTNEHSFDEFIHSRQSIYAHKAKRYPMYFSHVSSSLWPRAPILVTDSTTANLRSQLLNWMGSSGTVGMLDKDKIGKKILKKLQSKLSSELDKAITLDLFLKKKQIHQDSTRRNSGRLISYFYTQRYLELFDGEIICSLPKLSFFDSLSNNKYQNSYKLLKSILDIVGITTYLFEPEFYIVKLIQFISHHHYKALQTELLATIDGLVHLAESEFSGDIGRGIIAYQASAISDVNTNNNVGEFIASAISELHKRSLSLSQKSPAFSQAYKISKANISMHKRILIVTATPLEAKAFLRAMMNKGFYPKPHSVDNVTYWNFGVIGNAEIKMVKITDMGSEKVSGSTLVINEAISTLDPDFIIMVGIAFGLKRKTQQIGNILVSRELENYDSAKITDGQTVQRGHKIPAGALLRDRFDSSSLIYTKGEVELGFIISGNKLVDSQQFVEALKKAFPEAIGGEMEGTGLQASCDRAKKEWILIKGICDWGYDKQHENKEKDQEIAINNVCDFLIFTLTQFEF